MSEKGVLLWVNLNHSNTETNGRALFEKHFAVAEADQTFLASGRELTSDVVAICFDFDYPDLSGLDLLRALRIKYPRVPLLMLTEQHSEALAIWALQMRVWDFIVKPLNARRASQEIEKLQQQLCCGQHWEETPFSTNTAPAIPEEARFYNGSQEERALAPAISYIQSHFTEKITEEQMAALCRLRPFQFSRNFKKYCGVTFQEFVQRTRIEEAMRLLQNPNITVLDVAISAGFRDQSYFTRVFKKHTGIAPTTYRDNRNGSGTSHTESITENLELFRDAAPAYKVQ